MRAGARRRHRRRSASTMHTLRIHLRQPVPFLPGLVGHQFFRPSPQAGHRALRRRWTQPGNIVTSGAFMLEIWRPYDRIVDEAQPVVLGRRQRAARSASRSIAVEDQTTMMNLYKAGEVDATYNHTVPAPWIDAVRRTCSDYMDAPEAATEYLRRSTRTRPPTNDVRVRKAFNMAVDKAALAASGASPSR